MDRNFFITLVLYLVIALVIYFHDLYRLFWQVPRRQHVLLGTAVAFIGAVVGGGLFARSPVGGILIELLGAALGAHVLVFIAVKVGTPASVVLTIETDGVAGHAAEFARQGFAAPFVWPYHFNVEKYGSVIFELTGKPGTEISIEFPPDNTPFGTDREGKPRTSFAGTVPGRIVASPTVKPSRGKYLIRKKDPDTGAVVVNDPSWDTPKRYD